MNSAGITFLYGDERIHCERVMRTADVTRVLIKVHPDCRVQVSAPAQASDSEILAAVRKRSRWIYLQLREFRAQLMHVTSRRYVSGEAHYYLGRQHMLKVIEISKEFSQTSPQERQQVKLLRGRLEVCVRRNDPVTVQSLLVEWYKARAREVFSRRLDSVLSQALWVDVRPPLHILSMTKQWGSCSPNGRLTLNPHLVKAPRECIDYVILHELCHLAEHNHSERFYRLMGQVMPEWETIKKRLDGMAANLLGA